MQQDQLNAQYEDDKISAPAPPKALGKNLYTSPKQSSVSSHHDEVPAWLTAEARYRANYSFLRAFF